LTPAESRYPVGELETLAVIWCIRKWQAYLVGRSFIVVTDHRALAFKTHFDKVSTRLVRYQLELQQYDYKTIYRAGKDNAVPDYLSRHVSASSLAAAVDLREGKALGTVMGQAQTTIRRKRHRKQFDPQQQIWLAAFPLATLTRAMQNARNRPPIATEEEEPDEQEARVIIDDGEEEDAGQEERGADEPMDVEREPAPENTTEPLADAISVLGFGLTEFVEMQKKDTSLEGLHDTLEQAKRAGEESAAATGCRVFACPDTKLLFWLDSYRTPAVARLPTEDAMQHDLEEARVLPRDALLIVPLDARQLVMHHLHDEVPFGGHFGLRKTLTTVRSRFYWPQMQRDIRDYIASCSTCQQTKGIRSRLPGVPNRSLPQRPREQWQIDVIGPFQKTPEGFTHIIAAVDEFSGWVELAAIKTVDARSTALFILRDIVSRHGMPHRILTDRGSNFEAETTKALCRLMGINKTASSPMHPMTQGLVERINGQVVAVIQRMVEARNKGTDWGSWLGLAAGALRMAPNQFGITPFALMSGGTNPKTTVDVLSNWDDDLDRVLAMSAADAEAGTPHTQLTTVQKAQLRELHDLILVNKTIVRRQQQMVQQARQRVQDQMDRVATVSTHSPRGHFNTGAKVWVYVPNERARKFWKFWTGPFVIKETYRDRVAKVFAESRPSHVIMVHYDRLKPWRDPALVFAGAQGGDPPRPDGDETEFEVEAIMDVRTSTEGVTQYLVHWNGYTARYDDWVDEVDLHAPQVLQEFKRARELATKEN
jgi:hypothetical protein